MGQLRKKRDTAWLNFSTAVLHNGAVENISLLSSQLYRCGLLYPGRLLDICPKSNHPAGGGCLGVLEQLRMKRAMYHHRVGRKQCIYGFRYCFVAVSLTPNT